MKCGVLSTMKKGLKCGVLSSMKKGLKSLVGYVRGTRAVSALEYAVLAGVIVVGMAAALATFSDTITAALANIGKNITATTKDTGK